MPQVWLDSIAGPKHSTNHNFTITLSAPNPRRPHLAVAALSQLFDERNVGGRDCGQGVERWPEVVGESREAQA